MTESASRELRLAIIDRLSDESIGFNHYLAESSAEYEVDPFEIDFSKHSSNFFQAQINPKNLTDTSYFTFPVMCVYSMKGENSGDRGISTSFDGDVLVSIDVHITWDGSEPLNDFESRSDAIEAALMSAFDIQQNPAGVIEARYAFTRGPLTQSGNNWLATFSFRMVSSVTER